MKRALILFGILGMVLGITAFQCASAELTGAKLYINQKQYEKAKESLLKDVEKNPANDEGWYLLGFLYGEEDNIPKMIESFNNSLKSSKKFEPQIKESKNYYWATNFNKGVSFFNNATKASTEDSVKMFFNKAANNFNNAILCQPDSAVTYENLAYVYINLNQIDNAIEPLNKMIKVGSTPEAYALLGQIYTDKGNLLMDTYRTSKVASDSVQALENYNKAIKVLEDGKLKYPSNGEILLRVSNAYIAANKLDVAMTAFKEGVERDPQNKFYKYNYGVLLLNAADFPAAEEQFKKAIELDSEYTNAIYNLGVVYVRWGTQIREEAEAQGKTDDSYKDKFKLALPLMEKYLEKSPNEPAIWELLGKIYANLGNAQKSKEAFDKADQYR
ncbi:MAG: tetratricopeptide repeat protein [Ignavibacteria bacterium]|nr:tetratricopeptide repeat protein [Ignavibacteria bacterium]